MTRTIAIDGSAGSGKSTTARMVARELGYTYLDTGAMYRASALLASQENIPLNDGSTLASLLESHSMAIRDGRVLLDGEDLTEAIRRPGVAEMASLVSARPEVRRVMVGLQREVAGGGEVVAEGRDMGTVVFPDAVLKVYMYADVAVRAMRRLTQGEHEGSDLRLVVRSLLRRDRRDRTRADSPLRAAPDSLWVDTSSMTVRRQVDVVLEEYSRRVVS
ncbi:(d)CMP kinase [Candidatus Fermentibacteria bacterium]|nr:(d)CMP kinase [Candidatus Fermentibacteria bacterium]